MDPSVIVSDQSVANADPCAIVYSNIELVNALFGEHLRADEIAPDALRSYYVDYYLAQVNNGGFSQFVYNSHWSPLMNGFIRDGLAAMKAVGHLALFNENAAFLDRLGADRLQAFFESEYFDSNPERDALDANNDRFYTHQHNGQRVLAWHFLTDKGHHYMVDADGKAVMFDGTTKEMVTEVEAP